MKIPHCRLPKIGFVSLGQGPRPDLDAVHRRLLERAGCAAETVWRHALDGFDAERLARMAACDGFPAIRSNLREEGAEGPLGTGWTARWLDRDAFVAPVQDCIDALESEENVDLTLVCAAEAFLEPRFRSSKPVVFPPVALAAYARMLAVTKPGATVALLVYGDRQRQQQKAGWSAMPWARGLDLVFCGHGNDIDAAGDELSRLAPDLVLVWAYGAATGSGRAGPDALSRRLGVPVVTAAAASIAMVLNLLPAVDREVSR